MAVTYEIRLYSIVPGRHDVAYERFEHHLPRMFQRHGIRNMGCWTAMAGPKGPMFVYLLAYRDLAERERQWNAFYGDPEWPEIRSLTQGDEEATERFDLFLLRTVPMWSPSPYEGSDNLDGVQELAFVEMALGKNQPAYEYLKDIYLPAIERVGGRVLLAADFLAGPNLPRVAILTSWTDAEVYRNAMHVLVGDAGLQSSLAEQRQLFGRTLLGYADSYLLEPAPFALPLATMGNPIG